MKDFQKSRSALLQEIHGFISDVLEEIHDTRHGSPQEKKEYRRLKIIKEELDSWIGELLLSEKFEVRNKSPRSIE